MKKPFKHESRVIPVEEIMANRCSAYEFIDFDKQETLEEYFLANIKNVLQFGNDAQAIRFMEKYFEAKKEQERSYSDEEMKRAFKAGFSIGYGSPVNGLDSKDETCEVWFNQFKKK
jgi:hypothetical protein